MPESERSELPAASDSHVMAVSRALRVLNAFYGDESFVSLAELARRTGMHKPTVLRLARTLEHARYLVRREDGAWRLGPSAGLLGARYQAQFDVNTIVEPYLVELSQMSGESASLYVYENNARSCLLRYEGPRALPQHVRSGEVLPLDRGSAGRVILAALGEPGAIYDEIRRQGYSVTRGERSATSASVAVVVYGTRRSVLGSVSVAGPADRLSDAQLHSYAPAMMQAAAQISWKLGGVSASALRSTWHPN